MTKRHTSPEEMDAILSKPTMTVDELSAVLGVGRGQAYAAVREGQVRSLRIGKRILIPTTAVREMLGREGAE
jgi:excisionase family DNA binding protein